MIVCWARLPVIFWGAFFIFTTVFQTRICAEPLETFTLPCGMQWGRLYGNDLVPTDMVSVSDGYVLSAVQWDGTGLGGIQWGTGISARLVKLDRSGNLVFDRPVFDPADPGPITSALGIDRVPADDGTGEDGFVISGLKWQVHNDPDGRSFEQRDMWLVRTDNGGEFTWEKTFGRYGDEWANDAAVVWDTASGSCDFYLGGLQPDGSNQIWDGWILRTSALAEVWSNGWDDPGGPSDEVYCVEAAPDGGVVMGTKTAIQKMDGSGVPEWTAQTGTPTAWFKIRHTPVEGGYIAVGSRKDSGTFDGCYGGICGDLVLAKLDSGGNVVWIRSFGEDGKPDAGYDVIRTSSGGYAAVGMTGSYQPGTDVSLWVLAVDRDGHLEWDVPVGGDGYDMGIAIAEDTGSEPGFFVAGKTFFDQYNENGDPGPDGVREGHVWVLKTRGFYSRPEASFSWSSADPVFVYQAISFDGSLSSDGDGEISTYEWDFDGDGSADAFGPHPSHSFSSPGNYTVTLTVKDDDCLFDRTSQTIAVAGPEILWQRTFTNERDCEDPLNCYTDLRGNDIITGIGGGFAITGYSFFGYPPGSRNNDMWLLKTFDNGIMAWQSNLTRDPGVHEMGAALAATPDNGYVITGEFQSRPTDLQYPRLSLARTDAQGNVLWHTRFGNDPMTLFKCTGVDVLSLSSGEIVVGGNRYLDAEGWSMWLLRTDAMGLEVPGGSLVHSTPEEYNGSAFLKSIAQDTPDGFLFSGNYSGFSTGIDGAVPVVRTDGYLNPDWSFVWDSSGSGTNCGRWVQRLDDGVVVGGCTADRLSLRKLDTAQEEVWHTVVEAEDFRGCFDAGAPTPDGGVVLVGSAQECSSGCTDSGIFVAKFSRAGRMEWYKFLPGEDDFYHDARGDGVIALDDGSVVVLGNECHYQGAYGCRSRLMKIAPYVSLVAAFDTITRDGFIPLEIQFTDLSSGGTAPVAYEWDFDGDGAVDSTDQNPVFVFPERRTYSPSLTVTDDNGQTDTFVCESCILARDPGVFTGAEGVTITDFSVTDRAGSQPETYDFALAPEGVNSGSAFGFTVAAVGGDGTYPFQVTFPRPYDPEMILYKLPDWIEIPFAVIDEYTIEVELSITGGQLDPPFVLTAYFPLKTLTLLVEGSGTTEPAPGVHSWYMEGAVLRVTVRALPDTCWQFDHWSGAFTGSYNPRTITFFSSTPDQTVTAHFTPLSLPGDSEPDGDVDGMDIYRLLVRTGGGTPEMLQALAGSFGAVGCQ